MAFKFKCILANRVANRVTLMAIEYLMNLPSKSHNINCVTIIGTSCGRKYAWSRWDIHNTVRRLILKMQRKRTKRMTLLWFSDRTKLHWIFFVVFRGFSLCSHINGDVAANDQPNLWTLYFSLYKQKRMSVSCANTSSWLFEARDSAPMSFSE